MNVKRKPNESIGALLRRFGNLVKQTRHVVNAKSRRYFQKDLTERKERNRAIMGSHLSQLRKRLQRMGQYDNETFSLEKKKVKQKIRL